jgi:tRNA dimethylallyltransferase
MLARGALDEARAELSHWQPSRPSAKAIGAPELIAYLRGQITLDEAAGAAKIATRQYARRQRSWFRNRMTSWRSVSLP